MRAPQHQQPKVSVAYKWLATYTHEGLALDLFGSLDEDGYEVNDVALVGTNIALHELVPVAFLDRLSTWCDDHLPTAAELRRASREEGRVEREVWNRRLYG